VDAKRLREHKESALTLAKLQAALEIYEKMDKNKTEHADDLSNKTSSNKEENEFNINNQLLLKLIRATRVELSQSVEEKQQLKECVAKLQIKNLEMENKCRKLEVENRVAIEFLMQVDTSANGNSYVGENKDLSDHRTMKLDIRDFGSNEDGDNDMNNSGINMNMQLDASKVRIHRTGSMEITFETHSNDSIEEENPISFFSKLKNINKQVNSNDVNCDINLVDEHVAILRKLFIENDMTFPLRKLSQAVKNDEGIRFNYELLAPIDDEEIAADTLYVKLGVESERLVALKENSESEFKDLLQLLISDLL